MRNSINYAGQVILFRVRYAERRTLEIAVHPDGKVVVGAPAGTPLEVIYALVNKRARWIKRKIDYFNQFEPRTPPRRYVGGETHFYLGKQYRLKLVKGTTDEVKLVGGRFVVTTSHPNKSNYVKDLLNEWYAQHANVIFLKRLVACYNVAKGLKVPFPNVKSRVMTKRWGSCSKNGRIILNRALIKAPLHCIDYVIMHELCHLKIPYHNKRFVQLLSKYMPDWGIRKGRLEHIS